MSDSGHPSRHGFRQCEACCAWRRADGIEASTVRPGHNFCADVNWCMREVERRIDMRLPSYSVMAATTPHSPVVSETAPKPGWDANGTPIEQGGEL